MKLSDFPIGSVIWWGLVLGVTILIVLSGVKQSDPNFRLQKAKEQGYWGSQIVWLGLKRTGE